MGIHADRALLCHGKLHPVGIQLHHYVVSHTLSTLLRQVKVRHRVKPPRVRLERNDAQSLNVDPSTLSPRTSSGMPGMVITICGLSWRVVARGGWRDAASALASIEEDE